MLAATISTDNAGRVVESAWRTTQGAKGLAWSPDGKLLAVSSSSGIYLYDPKTLNEVHLIKTGVRVANVAFSPDGKLLASANWDKTVKLWDVASGQEVRSLSGHTNNVMRVAFSLDGKQLVSGSWDNTVKL